MSKNRIYIFVEGGLVQGCCADDPSLEVTVIDRDNGNCCDETKKENEYLTKEAKAMNPIY